MSDALTTIILVILGGLGVNLYLRKKQNKKWLEAQYKEGLMREIKKLDDTSLSDLVKQANTRNRRDQDHSKK